MHIRDRCRMCAGLVYIDKRAREVSLFESESKAVWNVDIRKDSAEIQPVYRFANDRRKHMNLLERLTNTCLTKAALSPLCGGLHSCKEATISIS